jgi:hypothetical protein
MDGIACPQHRPTVYSHQTREQGFLSGAALSHHAALGGGAFSGMQSPQAWIFYAGLTIWVSGLPNLYMEYIVFNRACLSYVRAIMAFMRVSLVELLHQVAM